MPLGLEEGEDATALAHGDPGVLSQPGPPDGLADAAALAVVVLEALDPEDAFQVALPVAVGAVDHLVGADEESGADELGAARVRRIMHGFVQVMEGFVVVLDRHAAVDGRQDGVASRVCSTRTGVLVGRRGPVAAGLVQQ